MAAEEVPHPNARQPAAETGGHMDMSVVVKHLDHATSMVQVGGEVDMVTGPLLHQHLSQLLATRPERLVIDLGRVTFLGSTGLSVLIAARHIAARQSTTLQLTGTSHHAVTVPLEISGLHHLFETLPPSDDVEHQAPITGSQDG